MSYQVYGGSIIYDCTHFVKIATATNYDTLCANYNMTNPDLMKFWINATWYGDDSSYMQKFKE